MIYVPYPKLLSIYDRSMQSIFVTIDFRHNSEVPWATAQPDTSTSPLQSAQRWGVFRDKPNDMSVRFVNMNGESPRWSGFNNWYTRFFRFQLTIVQDYFTIHPRFLSDDAACLSIFLSLGKRHNQSRMTDLDHILCASSQVSLGVMKKCVSILSFVIAYVFCIGCTSMKELPGVANFYLIFFPSCYLST